VYGEVAIMSGAFVAVLFGAVVLSANTQAQRTVVQRIPYLVPRAAASVSADGRFVAFESLAQLVAADMVAVMDIYLLEANSGRVELISAGPDGAAMRDTSAAPQLSGDGRYVVFESITQRPRNPCVTLFMWDRHRATTRPLVGARDEPARVLCAARPAMSSDGQWVALESEDVVKGSGANRIQTDVYIVNAQNGHTARVSLASDEAPVVGRSFAASVSRTGQLVAFTSTPCLDRAPNTPRVPADEPW
jgi:Tol biopolymer transport system component